MCLLNRRVERRQYSAPPKHQHSSAVLTLSACVYVHMLALLVARAIQIGSITGERVYAPHYSQPQLLTLRLGCSGILPEGNHNCSDLLDFIGISRLLSFLCQEIQQEHLRIYYTLCLGQLLCKLQIGIRGVRWIFFGGYVLGGVIPWNP